MSINDLLLVLVRISFVLLGGITFIDFLRHRDQTRLSITLMFNSLAITLGVSFVTQVTGVRIPWLNTVSTLALIAQPYLLLRIVEHFRNVRPAIHRAALIGMVLSWVIVLLGGLPRLVTIVMVLYFVLVNGYAMTAFIRGALTVTGVVRQRLRFAAIGSGLLALALLMLGLAVALPSLAALTTLLVELAAVLSAWSYYLAFAPPRWLHSTWQLAELRRFLIQTADQQSVERPAQTLERFGLAATQAVGGIAAATALWDETAAQLTLQPHAEYPSLSGVVSANDGIIGRAWRERVPLCADTPANFGADERRLMEIIGAKAMLVIPIEASGHAWGLLLVFLHNRSLFVEDDLSLLTLFAEQTAIVLENGVLLAEQQVLLEQVRDHAQKMEAANKELEAFSYSVSHDLRAPLRAVDGFSRILLEEYGTGLPSEGARYLTLVRTNAQQMGELIDGLLTFSRLSRQSLNKQPVVLTDLVHRVLDDLRDEQAGRQVEITVRELPACQGDPMLLKQVFVNLLANALKFTRKRDVACIEVGWQPADGQVAYFVKDNGAGFDPQYVHKLFGVFQRLHRNEDFEGTGVGLAIVRRVIERHGGRIWVEAAVDKGATFYFTLGEEVTEAPVLASA